MLGNNRWEPCLFAHVFAMRRLRGNGSLSAEPQALRAETYQALPLGYSYRLWQPGSLVPARCKLARFAKQYKDGGRGGAL